MRIVLPLALILLAGCSGSDQPQAIESGFPEVEADEQTFEDTIVVLGETYLLAADRDLPGTAMEVPEGGSSLTASLELRGAPCGTAADPATTRGVSVAFTSPSGITQAVQLAGALGCNAGGVATTSTASSGLAYEAGTWQVVFSGRGAGVALHVVVVAEPADG